MKFFLIKYSDFVSSSFYIKNHKKDSRFKIFKIFNNATYINLKNTHCFIKKYLFKLFNNLIN
jgi:hypothetical protein